MFTIAPYIILALSAGALFLSADKFAEAHLSHAALSSFPQSPTAMLGLAMLGWVATILSLVLGLMMVSLSMLTAIVYLVTMVMAVGGLVVTMRLLQKETTHMGAASLVSLVGWGLCTIVVSVILWW
jgi:hypothetical protein